MAGGDVFITGRIKDIIIRAGRHLYPQEIEEAVGLIPGMRKGCVAVFGALDPRSGTERVVVVAETAETDPETRAPLTAHAQQVVSEVSGAVADEIVLVPPHAAPKTSSGKIRRSAAKALYEQGCLGAPKQAVWRQLTRLAFAGLRTPYAAFFRRLAQSSLCLLVVDGGGSRLCHRLAWGDDHPEVSRVAGPSLA